MPRSQRVRQQNRLAARHSTGFTLVELLVTIAIIAALLALLMPAIQQVRERARSTQCRNNLKQQGIALANFAERNGQLPPGNDYFEGRGTSWCTQLLPALDQAAVFNQYRMDRPWDDLSAESSNGTAAEAFVPAFICPSTPGGQPGQTDYGGVYGSTIGGLYPGFGVGAGWETGTLLAIRSGVAPARNEPVNLSEVSDGLSQTLCVIEVAGRPLESGRWACGANCIPIDAPLNSDPDGGTSAYSYHDNGVHALFGDGRVSFLSENTDLMVLAAISTRNRNESVEQEF